MADAKNSLGHAGTAITVGGYLLLAAIGRVPVADGVVKALLWSIEGASLVLLAAGFVARRWYLRDPNRSWHSILESGPTTTQLWLRRKPLWPASDIKRHIRFALHEDLERLVALNLAAFCKSKYESTAHALRMRNAAFIRRNHNCFLLIEDPDNGAELIGYSCVLPLNAAGKQLYLDGGIVDSRFPSELIAKRRERPAAVLIFAIHLRPEYSPLTSMRNRRYMPYFASCIRHHLHSVIGQHACAVYAETPHGGLKSRLRRIGFEKTGRMSRDREAIWHMDVPRGN